MLQITGKTLIISINLHLRNTSGFLKVFNSCAASFIPFIDLYSKVSLRFQRRDSSSHSRIQSCNCSIQKFEDNAPGWQLACFPKMGSGQKRSYKSPYLTKLMAFPKATELKCHTMSMRQKQLFNMYVGRIAQAYS